MAAEKEFVKTIRSNVKDRPVQQQVEWKNDSFCFRANVIDGDKLAAQLFDLSIDFLKTPNLSEDQFDDLLMKIQKEITYLPAKFRLVEKDIARSQAILRSENPQQKNKVVEYFQLLVSPAVSMRLEKIRNQDNKNEAIPYVLSYDLVEQFVKDCINLVDNLSEIN